MYILFEGRHIVLYIYDIYIYIYIYTCHIVRQTIYKNNALIISQEKSLSRVVGRMNMLYSPAVSSLRFVKGQANVSFLFELFAKIVNSFTVLNV